MVSRTVGEALLELYRRHKDGTTRISIREAHIDELLDRGLAGPVLIKGTPCFRPTPTGIEFAQKRGTPEMANDGKRTRGRPKL